MFKSTIALAQKSTSPVVLSRLTIAGKCSSVIGTFVIVNRDGWIVTAGHIHDPRPTAKKNEVYPAKRNSY
jgi:hypothetical protein